MRAPVLLGTLLISTPALAADVLPGPKAAKDFEIANFLKTHCKLEWPMSVSRFKPNGFYDARGTMGERSDGKWTVARDTIVITATDSGGPCDDEDCPPSRPDLTRYTSVKVSASLLSMKVGKGEVLFRCDGKTGCNSDGCPKVDAAVQVRPGHADKTQHGKVLKALAAWKTDEGVVVKGDKPRNPRARTEIWFKDDREGASAVAKVLEPLIGKVEPKRWKWGGAYEVIVIVGKR